MRHLNGDVARDVGRAAASTPRLGLQKLAGVVGAVAETRSVEGRVRAIHLFLRVALGEQVHGHDSGPLFEKKRGSSEGKGPPVAIVKVLLRAAGPVHDLVVDAGDV